MIHRLAQRQYQGWKEENEQRGSNKTLFLEMMIRKSLQNLTNSHLLFFLADPVERNDVDG